MINTNPSPAGFSHIIDALTDHLKKSEENIQIKEQKTANFYKEDVKPKLNVADSMPSKRIEVGDSEKIEQYQKRLMRESSSARLKFLTETRKQTERLSINLASHIMLTSSIYLVLEHVMSSPKIKEKISSELWNLTKDNVGLKNSIIAEILPEVIKRVLDHPFVAINMVFLSLSGKDLFKDAKKIIESILSNTLLASDMKSGEKQRWMNTFSLFQKDLRNQNIPGIMDPENKVVFEGYFESLRLEMTGLENNYTGSHDFRDIQRIWNHLTHLLKYPVETTDVYLYGKHGNVEAAEALDKTQALELSIYREPVVSQWGTFLQACRTWFGTREGGAPVAFMTSGPATGKTELVKRTAKSVLQAEIIVASKSDVEKFLGAEKSYRYYHSSRDTIAEQLGIILNAIAEKAKTKNFLLFLDEFDLSQPEDQYLFDALKSWLNVHDPVNPQHPIYSNRPDFRCPVVIANNTKKIHDRALKDRILEHILFPAPDSEQIKTWAIIFLENTLLPGTLKADVHQDQSVNKAGDLVRQMLPFILQERQKYVDDGLQDEITIREVKRAMQFDVFNACVSAYDRNIPVDEVAIKRAIINRLLAVAEQAGWKAKSGRALDITVSQPEDLKKLRDRRMANLNIV